ncbi:MAG: glmZ(sRNA)-inactivating NTPase [Actinobacteria bacterium BACL2 MAG-121001-bin67]|jgi:RNase adapter protein RapZ|uniref:GlmZ(SRNA)-inactivating NTPase n=3 Tax=ac1 cluster TaxID=1655545 RepID=A0A0R2P7V1_9ACTN|nr:MAG: glmZ(sRNA)-inactivating NTPase [Actinobacteria bacterium BACL2 MAG-121001-bin67]KRO45371.1 MAG: glmZ(sRNA)-inactivating NTPase [Actinobacteria bacterium BACL2 MAG-120813-bin23]KRO53492.1 MAG: glmZ(sRNA)-inactivating NTPase [Actinobacteria bacterium BACL2 MAG-120820-bin50]KRO73596.1 MAG: glmZ(sRNA)-inactivating NTPase [Actinobacteria bacterium BACL2 MAG-120920-bin34]KRP31100.1 MAG: glmZ(sRNA)-inactivating NTPase [Actinobacteria bacterium BACL2 MAG-120507-bin38]MDP4615038.1 RNase adapter
MGREIVVITGMSGAGRSTVAHAMEDHGWYVIDNLPPSLLIPLFDLTQSSDDSIAVVIDVRGRQFFDDLNQTLAELAERGISRKIIFVDAADDVLVRRFESSRRPHPLQGSDRIVDGIEKERDRLRELRSGADLVVDSSQLNVHQLEKKIAELFSVDPSASLKVNVLSFGYKFGLPVDADLVMDCRFIPNPHWNPELRAMNGLDKQVSEAVLNAESVGEFLEKYLSLFNSLGQGYLREGKKYITLAIGCTGGKHRSVAVAEELARRINGSAIDAEHSVSAHAIHRDLGRER